MTTSVLTTTYLGPINYYIKFMQGEVCLEQYDTYVKQTYRNRCLIMTANGIENLSIPVIRPNGNHTLVKDVRIDNSKKWQQQHWRALISAYNNTPFFEFYADEFAPFYHERFEFLSDYNYELIQVLLDLLSIESKVSFTSEYQKDLPEDYRDAYHPKKKCADPFITPMTYHQVFQEKFGFVSGLSVIDLLFNCGPESVLILKKSYS